MDVDNVTWQGTLNEVTLNVLQCAFADSNLACRHSTVKSS